ncbi:MAG TPA: endonuclease domain-containing protein [Xanthobacteraceae bacterium]|jgi:very-short-patch-repair endonuclease|nr:endonuclease domain-containing protein [Xanthobacteraceae bacterium]
MVVEEQQRQIDRRVRRARQLRRAMTDAERKLWWHLRRLPMEGAHFRRQATIGPYFADFACHEQRLVIEVDGGQHALADRASADANRTAFLQSQGYRVLRFWNNDVLTNIESVLRVIHAELEQSPHP